MDNQLMPFEANHNRKIWHNDQWFFSIIDVLTNTDRHRKYWADLKKKIGTEGFSETSENFGQLKMLATEQKVVSSENYLGIDKKRKMNCPIVRQIHNSLQCLHCKLCN